MTPLSKLCDAADWLDPEFDRIVRAELEETPRLHRKQWEFAQILRALQSLGCLKPQARGLSMGGGRELLLYSVARRAGHLTVTDLYEAGSSWDGARTDDPDRSLKATAPFAIDPSRLTARRMDMRALEFPDKSFDFCYSSCALEHIGTDDDFLRHLREVRRVMKDDGIYVLTTEFHYGDEVIEVPHNYYFVTGFLNELVRAASLAAGGGVNAALAPHEFNRPLPANLCDLCADPRDGITGMLLKSVPHVQLLIGGLPFTSLSLVLTKPTPGASTGILPMAGLETSRRFIEDGVRTWKAFVEGARLKLDPFGLIPELRPAREVPRRVASDGDDTVFHTGYVWLGKAVRQATISLDLWPADASEAMIELRVHRKPTRQPDNVTCTGSEVLDVDTRERVRVNLRIVAEVSCSYAVVGKVTAGACWVGDVSVEVGAG